MDTLDQYRQITERILQHFVDRRYAYGDIQNEMVIDRQHDRYLVVSQGWEDKKRIHSTLIHLDIIDGKIWVQRDGTEDGIATRLVAAGVPKDRIVLAFYSPESRRLTDFAVA